MTKIGLIEKKNGLILSNSFNSIYESKTQLDKFELIWTSLDRFGQVSIRESGVNQIKQFQGKDFLNGNFS